MSRVRFTTVEAVAIGVAAAALGAILASTHMSPRETELWLFRSRYPRSEWLALERQYGPERQSIDADEWIIRDALKEQRGGVFLDVGASHYKLGSNTYYLEKNLGWSGIAVEARSEFGSDYGTQRPNTKFVAMFASDVTDQTAQLFVPATNLFIASKDAEDAARLGEPVTARTVPTTTLNAVLQQAQIDRIDLLNMDIEDAEPKALMGFDLNRYSPRLVCIEAHAETRQFILDYFYD